MQTKKEAAPEKVRLLCLRPVGGEPGIMNGEDALREHSGVAKFIIHRIFGIVQVNILLKCDRFMTFNCPFAGAVFCYAYCKKRRCCMVEKLVSLGFTQQMAEDIIWAYQDDLPGLKAYVRVIEIVAAHV